MILDDILDDIPASAAAQAAVRVALARSTEARARKQELQAACDAVDAELRSSADEMKVLLASARKALLASAQKGQADVEKLAVAMSHWQEVEDDRHSDQVRGSSAIAALDLLISLVDE